MDASSSTTGVPFWRITAHFIETEGWKRKNVFLGFEHLCGADSAEALSRVTFIDLCQFYRTNSIHAITADNASVNTSMFRLLEASIEPFTTAAGPVRCMAHVINLACQIILHELHISTMSLKLFLLIGLRMSSLTLLPALPVLL